ncbi:MAG: nickel-dependent lactate racemase [bacterium]
MKRHLSLQLPYGTELIEAKLAPAVIQGVMTPEAPPMADPARAITEALAHPLGAPPLDQIVQEGESVLIVVTDPTRKVPYPEVLPLLLVNLQRVSPGAIEFLVATGTHRAPDRHLLAAHLGREILDDYRVHIHDCRDSKQLQRLQPSARNTPVYLNRLLFEFDRVLVVGSITFHYYAGFTGGPKMVMPGCAGYDTIQHNHSLVLHPLAGHGKNPNAAPGVLDGNPVYEDNVEISRRANPDFALDVVLDTHDRIVGVFAGDPVKAHREGCAFVHTVFNVALDSRADVVIASAGGHPFDETYYQAHKAFDHAARALKPGGTLVLVAQLAGGIGSDSFLRWLKYKDLSKLEAEMRKKYDHVAHIAYCHLQKLEHANVTLISDLSRPIVEDLGFTPSASVEAAFGDATSGLFQPTVLIFPHASLTLPRVT